MTNYAIFWAISRI